MIESTDLSHLRSELDACVESDKELLERSRQQVRPLRDQTRRIHPHAATAVSIVGTDGGNNRIAFDPLLVELVRVVDSSNNEYCLEVVTSSANLDKIHERHLAPGGIPKTALGRMMKLLDVSTLWDLSVTIAAPPANPKPSWVQDYRELMEWAVILDLVRETTFGSDTVIIFDGQLRSKVFAPGKFKAYRQLLEAAIDRQFNERRRRIYIVALGKHSKVLDRYRLAMALEGVLRTTYPAYVAVPRPLQTQVYKWKNTRLVSCQRSRAQLPRDSSRERCSLSSSAVALVIRSGLRICSSARPTMLPQSSAMS